MKLEVSPQITPDGSILLTVDVSNDSPGPKTDAGLLIKTKHVQTQVLVENGGTVVIGGIYTETQNDDSAKVPFFGDLPLFGALFRTKATKREKSEMLVFITPKVLSEKVLGN